MGNWLQALGRAYDLRRQWTLSRPHLGIPGIVRHGFADFDSIPALDEPDFSGKTKDPTILCIETKAAGKLTLIPVAAGVSGRNGTRIVADLVRRGVHPLDIIVATWIAPGRMRGDTEHFVFRTAVDHLFWTSRDQDHLEAELAKSADVLKDV